MMTYIQKLDTWVLSIGLLAGFILFRTIFAKFLVPKLRHMASLTNTELDDELIDAFEYPLRFAIVASGVYFFILYSPTEFANDEWVKTFIRSVVIITFFRGLYNLSDTTYGIFDKVIQKSKYELDPDLVGMLSTFLKMVVIGLGFAVLAKEWGYDINGFVAGLGIGGLAIALAAKDSLANIFASMVIVIDKPFSIGDWVQTGNVEGIVERISFRSVGIRTFDQSLIYLPSSLLTVSAINNYARMSKRRARFTFGLTYDSTREQIQSISSDLIAYLQNHDNVLKDGIIVRFDTFGDSSLNILVQYFTSCIDAQGYHTVKEEVNLTIMDLTAKYGTSMAFPTRTVYIVNQNEEPQESTNSST